jgi:hypothetical protein
MSRRYAVLGISLVLALALAVPALGGPMNPIASISASAKKIANKALKQAKTAQKTAVAAQGTANTANSTANSALAEAKKAQTTATGAQTSANSAKTTAETARTAAAAAEANANTRFNKTEIVFGTSTPENTTTSKTAGATCGGPNVVMGGGFAVGGENEKVTVTASAPEFFYGEGWFASAKAISGTPTWSLQANVICGRK